MPQFPSLAGVHLRAETLLLTVLLQLIVIIGAARIFGWLLRWARQPVVVGEIAAGMLLGPSVFGHFFPNAWATVFHPAANDVFGVLSQLGLILLLFLVGLECDFGHLRLHGKAAVAISLVGIGLPFSLGMGLGPLLHPHLEASHFGQPVPLAGFTLFMGIAMSITAIPVLGRLMMELNITRTRIGTVTISAAAVDDACGWILLATICSVAQAGLQLWDSLRMIAGTIGFFLLMVFVVRPVLGGYIRRALRRGGGELSLNNLAVVIVVLLLSAMGTSLIGIFAVFGAFLLGTVLSGEAELRESLGRGLRPFLTVFFLPIFFTYTGLRTDIGALSTPAHWLALGGVLGCAILGKLGGCTCAARLSGFPAAEAACIGTMMNTRGLMELIVINVGRDLGMIPDSVFSMLVVMALVTTAMTTPLLMRFMRGTELEAHVRRSGFLGDAARDGAARPVAVDNSAPVGRKAVARALEPSGTWHATQRMLQRFVKPRRSSRT